MNLLSKHLTKELFKNKIFLVLMLILSSFTSFMYFFVHFSIDGNVMKLNSLSKLTQNQILYKNALISNTILARNVFIGLVMLSAFVFTMFFYHFFKVNEKQFGCLKSIGFKDKMLCNFFMAFTIIISLIGGLVGLCSGYFVSDVLINANLQSYLVTDLVKGISVTSIMIGIFIPAVVFCLISFFSYNIIRGKEIGLLIGGINDKYSYTIMLNFADKISRAFPVKNRFSIRIALRKPIAILLVLISVMSFSIMFILGYSLILSSPKVFESQTLGHNYLYDIHYDTVQSMQISSSESIFYLNEVGKIQHKNQWIEWTIGGLDENSELFKLLDEDGKMIKSPVEGEIVISSHLQELYDFKIGEKVTISVADNHRSMRVSGVAFNAKLNWVYISKNELSKILSLPIDSYTGILSMENEFEDGIVTTNEQRLDELQRGMVSNKISSIINQVVGCLVGCILLYLALLINFQSSTRDILILQIMGYKKNKIRKMLIDIYKPILWLSFCLTLWPSVQGVKLILRSLSIQIGDYMPFQTNIFVIAGIFVLLNVMYFFVQYTFNVGIVRVIKREDIADYIN